MSGAETPRPLTLIASSAVLMKPILLAVDDEIDALEMIKGHFEPRGYEVHTAQDGDEAVRFCENVTPHIILLDLKMKRMDGDEALPRLRQLAPNAKVVLITAYQGNLSRKKMEELGISLFLEKPISIVDVEKKIQSLIKNSLPPKGLDTP